jgi:hypothetical protein
MLARESLTNTPRSASDQGSTNSVEHPCRS